jgi:dihydroorotase-like cyclic amidohydrolase
LTEPVNTYYQELLTDKFILETLGLHTKDLYTESKAAVAGGVTSFIDMPNTVPNILTVESLKSMLLLQKSP